MESFWFCYGANYCNSKDDFGCIIREFRKIILLFFGFYEAYFLNLQAAPFLVKCNMGKRQTPTQSPSAVRLVDEPFGCELRAERLRWAKEGKGLKTEDAPVK